MAHTSLLQRLEVVHIFKTSSSGEKLDINRIVARMSVPEIGTTFIIMVTSIISGMTTKNRRVERECCLTKRKSIAAGLRHRSKQCQVQSLGALPAASADSGSGACRPPLLAVSGAVSGDGHLSLSRSCAKSCRSPMPADRVELFGAADTLARTWRCVGCKSR